MNKESCAVGDAVGVTFEDAPRGGGEQLVDGRPVQQRLLVLEETDHVVDELACLSRRRIVGTVACLGRRRVVETVASLTKRKVVGTVACLGRRRVVETSDALLEQHATDSYARQSQNETGSRRQVGRRMPAQGNARTDARTCDVLRKHRRTEDPRTRCLRSSLQDGQTYIKLLSIEDRCETGRPDAFDSALLPHASPHARS